MFSIQSFAEIDLSKNVEVYKGEGNLTVTMARILPLDSNQALLSVTGIDHEVSGLVFKYDLTVENGNRRLTTDIAGRRYNSFVETSRWGGKVQTLYIPGKREGIHLYFDSEASEKVKPSSLLKKHKQQGKSGELSAIQLFNRAKEEKSTNAKLTQKQEKVEEACGKAINVTVDWATISDDVIKEYGIAGYCEAATNSVISLCKDEPKKAWINQSIDVISCTFGDSIKLKLENKNLLFRTATEESNQNSFVKQNLRNLINE